MMNQDDLKSLLGRLVTFSSVKAGMIVVLLALAAFIRCMGGGKIDDFIISLDNRVADLMFRVRGTRATTGEVVIVDLDEKSLTEVGQWPWPRDLFAGLLRNIDSDAPKIIGLDMVFPEPDRTSPAPMAQRIEERGGKVHLPEQLDSNDTILGKAVAETPTVLGYVFVMHDDGQRRDGGPVPFPQFSIDVSKEEERLLGLNRVPEAYRPIQNVAEIVQFGAVSEGFFNALLDVTGMVRRVPLFALYQGTLYPSLSLEVLREGLGAPDAQIQMGGSRGIYRVVVGDCTIPTNRDGQMCINFRGPQKTFPYVSATDVLNHRLEPGTFADKYVLIGTSAEGLRDLRATPFDNAFPGVEIHANMIDNALAGDPMRNDVFVERGIVMTIIVAGGMILTLFLAYGGPLRGALSGVLLLAVVYVGNYWLFFLRNQLIGVTYAFFALSGVFVTVTVVNYFLEGREKRIIRGMFSTMVSGDVLQYMEDNPGSFSLAGETRQATMFFSDVAGFTTISESLTPEGLVQLLNAYLTPMTEIIMGYQGYVDKYEGDAIMAEWGVPFPSADHARLACFAALDQQKRLSEMREDLYERFGHRLFVRMGMNSGTVSAGNMGSTRRFSYTVMGDAVNQAARFEPANKDYGTDIMIGATTFDLAKDHIETRLLDKIIVKGKTEPIMIYELLARKGEIDANKAEVAGLYVEALRIHWERDFDSAIAKLQKGRDILPDDNPSKTLLARIQAYRQEPPPDTWQGEYVRASKD